MISPLTGSEITSVLEKKAKCLINFEVLSDVREISVLVKEVCVDLGRLLNTAFHDAHLSQVQRFEYVRQSILVALDDAEKVGTKLMEESIAIEKTKDALKRIEEARNFVKNQLPEMIDLILVLNDAVADGRIEMREVVGIVEAAQKVNWWNVCSACFACFACFGLCFQKKTVAVVGAVPVPAPVVVVIPAPESPTPQPPLTPPQGEPEPLEAPAPPQPSENPVAPETKPENV